MLDEVGWVQEVIVNRTTGHVVDGHLRVSLAIAREEKAIPVKYVELSPSEEALVLATLDPLAGMAATAKDALEELLAEVQPGSDAVTALLEDVAKGAGLSTVTEGLTDPDAVPEAEPVSERGDVWVCGEHRVMCGDSTDADDMSLLMTGEKAAVFFTDPPYGIGYDHAATGRAHKKFDRIENDGVESPELGRFFRDFLGAANPLLVDDGVLYVCAANKTAHVFVAAANAVGVHLAVPIVWVKQVFALNWDRYHPQHEMIYYGGPGSVPTGPKSRWFGPKNETTVWEIDRDASREYRHPTQKPVALAIRAISNSSSAGEIIADPFLGSGTTMIAAESLGRRCYGMEIEPRYVDVAVRRWEEFTGQKAELLHKAEAVSA